MNAPAGNAPIQSADLLHDPLLRRQEVERLTGLSRSAIYRLKAEGKFPTPLQVGPNAVRWLTSEIVAWRDSCRRAST